MEMAKRMMTGLPQSDPGAIAKRAAKNQDPEAIKQVAKQFESIFMHQVFKSMRSTLPKDGLMSGGFGEEMFTDMLDQEYAKLSIANQSMGLADTIADQLGGNSTPLDRAMAPEALKKLRASQAYADKKTAGQWSLPIQSPVAQKFGMHRGINDQNASFCDYVKFTSQDGDAVKAVRDGEVVAMSMQKPGRHRVTVKHANDFQTIYEGVGESQVEVGQRLRGGDQIGRMVSPGTGQPAELTIKVMHRGRAIDPMPLMTAK